MNATKRRLLDGRYRLGKLAGEGALSSVYCGRDERLGRRVALKMLKSQYCDDANFVRRFYNEARAAAALCDPHIVSIYDVIATNSGHAIVMEYVEGGSLAQRLAQQRTLSEREVVRVARDIAQALMAAHDQGILHRDIKPGNILLDKNGVAKVADFGLAKAMESNDLTMTQPGTMVGTVHYFSPEQAEGKPLSPASDLYSLGVIIYQALSGRLPYEADSPLGVAVAHVARPAPTRDELCTYMSAPLATIVAKLLSKDPAGRFQRAHELDAALAAHESQRNTETSGIMEAPTIIAPALSMPTVMQRLEQDGRQALKAGREIFTGWFSTLKERAGSANPDHVKFATAGALAGLLVLLSILAIAHGGHGAAAVRSSARAVPPSNQVVVPELRGWPLRKAAEFLADYRLRTHFAAKVSDAPANTVIEQIPSAHTPVRPGTDELVVISTGPRPTVQYSSGGGGDGGD